MSSLAQSEGIADADGVDGAPAFPGGGGTMGALIRHHAWATTPLGAVQNWPRGLRTIIRLMLNTRHPMFVFWGPTLACFYNDAYSVSLGPERHPSALGRPGREVWAEIWDTIGPQIEEVMSGRGATWHENHLVPITRHGRREDVYWTYSYSPIDDDDAVTGVGGVLVIGNETTAQVLAEKQRAEADEEFRALGENQPNLCWMAKADGWIYWYNRRWFEYTGTTPADMDGWGWQSVHDPELLPFVMERWTAAIAEGAAFEMTFPLRGADGVFRPFLTRIEPVRNEEGVITRWFGSNVDISEQQATAEALRQSGARFRAIQETSIDGFMMLESVRDGPGLNILDSPITDFRWLYANEAAERMISKPRSWFLGRRLLDEMPGNREEGLFDAYVQVVETGAPWTREFTYRHEGLDIYLRAVAAKVGDGFAISFADLSERRQAEELARENEARFRVLADSMPQMVWSTLPDGYHDYYNARWYEFTGVPAGSTDGEAWNGMFHEDDQARAWARWRESLATGEPYEIEYRLRRHDGVYRWTLGRALPLRDLSGAIVRWVGTCTDIEDTKQAAEVLARSRAELERLVEDRTAALMREVDERRKAEEALRQGEKLQAIGQLTGGIAHDFNNILQVVTSGATLLNRPTLTEDRRKVILDGITNAAQSAKELTSRLLAFARKQSLKPEAFDLNGRLTGMSELLRHTLGSRITLETDLASDLWPAVADVSQLEVAILNLSINARDAMQEKGGTLSFQTRNATLAATSERAAGDYVRLAVADSGVGMSPAVLARVFEPFFTTKELGKGTGLGLAQVHGFSKQSGGDIDVESAAGEGTTIIIHLPRAARAAIAAMAPSHTKDPAPAHPKQEAAGRTVLVVEDNPDVATFAGGMLKELGYTTRCAANADQALALLDAGEQVNAVFTDVVMPGEMNGLQLANIVRVRYPDIAIVLASGYSEAEAEWSGEVVRGAARQTISP